MASLKFIIKSTKNPASIYARFQNGKRDNNDDSKDALRIDLCKNTKLCVNPDFWDKGKGKVKNTTSVPNRFEINSHLSELENKIIYNYNQSLMEGEFIDSKWLGNVIQESFGQKKNNMLRKIFLTDYLAYWLEVNDGVRFHPVTKKLTTVGTMRSYKNVLDCMKDYEKNIGYRFKLNAINLDWHREYLNYMTNIRGFAENTTTSVLQKLKTMLKEGVSEHGITVHPQINSPKFTVPKGKKKPKHIYLSVPMIELIHNYKFNQDNQKLYGAARDWLVIACWTALRGGDLLKNVTIERVNWDENNITVFCKKLNKDVIIPLHPMIHQIIERNDGNFPKQMSMSAFGLHIKKIGEIINLNEPTFGGIRESVVLPNGEYKLDKKGNRITRRVFRTVPFYKLMSSHIGRRSFSTNLSDKVSDNAIKDTAYWASTEMKEHYNLAKKNHSREELAAYFEKGWGHLIQNKDDILNSTK